MADETRFSMGKRLVAAMRADGVDPTDQEAMDAWVARFNERPFAERDRIIGPPPSQPPVGEVGAAVLGRLPPVVLEPESDLEAMARSSVLFDRVVRLVDFIGDGRALTNRGNLTVADGKQLVDLLETDDRVDTRIGEHVYRTRSSAELAGVDLAFRVALAAGFLEMAGKRRVRGHDRLLLDEEPLEAHYRLLLALLDRVGPTAHHYGDRDTYGFGWFAEELDRGLLPVLIGLYEDQAPRTIDVISSGCWESLLETYDLDDVEDDKLEFHRGLVAHAFRRSLCRLEELNVVTREGIEHRLTEFGGTEESGGSVSLSALGTWSLQRLLSKATDAPVVGSLSGCDAGDLLRRAADLPEDLAMLEIDNWIGGRGHEGAELLVEAMCNAGDTGRSLGFRAVQRAGPSATGAVSQFVDHAELGAYASVWQVQTGIASAEGLDASGDSERFVRLLYALLVLWGPGVVCERLSDVAGRTGVSASLDAVWRVRSPETGAVLAVVGDLYPDKAVAKAARKSLFRFRSSGGAERS